MNSSYKTVSDIARLKTLLIELAHSGSPVDHSVTVSVVERPRVEIEQVGGFYDSRIFELADGRVAVMADIAVTNRITRFIDIVDVGLRTPWGAETWDWLSPRRINSTNGGKRYTYSLYRFPGKGGFEFEDDQVINHPLLECARLRGKSRHEGWLLGIGNRMPAELRQGQWVELLLTIVEADGTEYASPIKLVTERLTARTNVIKRPGLPAKITMTRSVASRDFGDTEPGQLAGEVPRSLDREYFGR